MLDRDIQNAIFDLERKFPDHSARRRLSDGQLVGCALIVAISGTAAYYVPRLAAEVAIGALIVFYAGHVLFRAVVAAAGAFPMPSRPPLARRDEDLPVYTVLAPLYREAAVAADFLAAMERLDYPREKLDLVIVLERDDDDTLTALESSGSALRPRIVSVPYSAPRTKPKACNVGLLQARGEFLVIYDAEDRPEPSQLREALAAFDSAGPDLACVQARLAPYNRTQSWIAALFAIDYCLWFDFTLPGLHRLGLPVPLGGTSNHFRVRQLRAAGAWDSYNVTEDADLGLRLRRLGWRVETIASTTFEEAPVSIAQWLPQRARWVRGYMQTFLVHVRGGGDRLIALGLRDWTTLLFFVAGSPIFGLANPIFWSLFAYWALTDTDSFAWMFGPAIEPVALASLMVGNAVALALAFVAPVRRRWWDLLLYAPLTVFYWALISVATYRAAWALAFKPFAWEKTRHGLSPPPLDPEAA